MIVKAPPLFSLFSFSRGAKVRKVRKLFRAGTLVSEYGQSPTFPRLAPTRLPGNSESEYLQFRCDSDVTPTWVRYEVWAILLPRPAGTPSERGKREARNPKSRSLEVIEFGSYLKFSMFWRHCRQKIVILQFRFANNNQSSNNINKWKRLK